MTQTYKKLNEKELKPIYKILRGYFDNNDKYASVINLVHEYFGKEKPVSILVSVNSEYNDEGYNNSIQNITVYDADENELPLTKQKRPEFQDAIEGVSLPEFESQSNYGSGTNDPVDDVVIFLNKTLPELYIKEIE